MHYGNKKQICVEVFIKAERRKVLEQGNIKIDLKERGYNVWIGFILLKSGPMSCCCEKGNGLSWANIAFSRRTLPSRI
jgi:hypothetical protein